MSNGREPATREPHGPLGVVLAWLVTLGVIVVLVYLLWV